MATSATIARVGQRVPSGGLARTSIGESLGMPSRRSKKSSAPPF